MDEREEGKVLPLLSLVHQSSSFRLAANSINPELTNKGSTWSSLIQEEEGSWTRERRGEVLSVLSLVHQPSSCLQRDGLNGSRGAAASQPGGCVTEPRPPPSSRARSMLAQYLEHGDQYSH